MRTFSSKPSYLSTSQIARQVGVHPNTVRLYEAWGYLSPVPRSPSGYRRFSESHLDQMRLARTALGGEWVGKQIRQSAYMIVKLVADGNLGGALEQAYRHLALVHAERAQADAAVQLLQRWAAGTTIDAGVGCLRIGQAASLLGLTRDILRNWEHSGLIQAQRDPVNHYRCYTGAELGRLRIIRMLRQAGYSLMAILRMLNHLDHGNAGDLRQVLDTPNPDEDIFSASDRWLTALNREEERTWQMIEQLETMIRKAQK